MAGYRENKNRELCVKKKKKKCGGLISLCLPKVQGQVQLEN